MSNYCILLGVDVSLDHRNRCWNKIVRNITNYFPVQQQQQQQTTTMTTALSVKKTISRSSPTKAISTSATATSSSSYSPSLNLGCESMEADEKSRQSYPLSSSTLETDSLIQIMPEEDEKKESNDDVNGNNNRRKGKVTSGDVAATETSAEGGHSSHSKEDTVIIPRLHIFKDMIQMVRQDDALRHSFLLANEEERRSMIYHLCPYFQS